MKITIEGTPEEVADAIRKLAEQQRTPVLMPAVATTCVHGIRLGFCATCSASTVPMIEPWQAPWCGTTGEASSGTSAWFWDRSDPAGLGGIRTNKS